MSAAVSARRHYSQIPGPRTQSRVYQRNSAAARAIGTSTTPTITRREVDVDAAKPNRLTIGNVLAIDDDSMTLRALQSHAKRNAYRLQTADSAESGLRLIDEATAVALVNLRMPRLNGFECLKYIRRNHPHVQVVILTGSTETDDAVEAMRAGAFQFVTKPFDPKQLLV
ncbi:MAG: response regulator [Planctomycetaceae bacterium]|nr:MAG: response regulator [Planctomycetaceae bacterium]